jgi:hypothetical protein
MTNNSELLPFDKERLASEACSTFGMIDTEQMMRTVKAMRKLNMSPHETRTAPPATDETITLGYKDSKTFVEALENPPEPNEKLVAAFVTDGEKR